MAGLFPENISTYGAEIDAVFWLIAAVVGVWFVAVEALLLYFLVRYRRRPGQAAAHVRGENLRELAWLLVPAVVILALDLMIDAAGGPVWARVKEGAPPGGVRVEVTAKQFNWDITYPGPDGQFGSADDKTLENELHVPVGENVHVLLRSKDVIHSFFLPNVRLKQDILPGREIRAWFNATTTGQYELACAELCGFGHSGMRGFLTVHSTDDYHQWERMIWPAQTAAAEGGTR